MRLLPIAFLMAAPAFAQPCPVTTSGARTVALVELYTSEGCSSCPPADRWLSGFVGSRGQQRYVPVAFHVSYWDYIGWQDAFAELRFTERQRAFASATGARNVYTPQVILGGRDFRGWPSERGFQDGIEAINRVAARAVLEIRAQPKGSGDGVLAQVTARAVPGVEVKDLALVAVLTQNGLASRVTAGENRGELLRHDFVARDLSASREWSSEPRPSAHVIADFKRRPDWVLDKMAVTAFVQNLRTGEILQALSAPLCQ
jgi:hypothetical protein